MRKPSKEDWLELAKAIIGAIVWFVLSFLFAAMCVAASDCRWA